MGRYLFLSDLGQLVGQGWWSAVCLDDVQIQKEVVPKHKCMHWHVTITMPKF
jgi:hypothetical protein